MSQLVLVVEDNPINQKVTIGLLQGAGYTTDLAVDGLEAILAYRRKTYDLVVMDCQMPRCDGWEATRAIRRLEASTGRRVPIIALTAQALAGDREKCLNAGMDDYLTKPVDGELFITAVHTRLGRPAAPGNSSAGIGSGPAVAVHDQPLIDQGVIRNLRQYGQDTVTEVFTLLLKDLPGLRDRLEQAIAQADPAEVAKVAHRLKGGCGTAGVVALAKAMDRLDRQANAGDSAALALAWPSIEILIAQTTVAIRALAEGREAKP